MLMPRLRGWELTWDGNGGLILAGWEAYMHMERQQYLIEDKT